MTTPTNKDLTSSSSKPVARHTRIEASMYSGPIPPADDLIKYEKACPGAADRIIAMAERQSKHRQELEKKVIGGNVQNEKVGMYLAFILTILMMFIGLYLIMNNKSVVGYIAFFAPGFFQAGNYVFNKYREYRHSKPKKPESTPKVLPA